MMLIEIRVSIITQLWIIYKNNIKTIGDFHEIYIMTRVGMDGKIKSLGQIEILIDK